MSLKVHALSDEMKEMLTCDLTSEVEELDQVNNAPMRSFRGPANSLMFPSIACGMGVLLNVWYLGIGSVFRPRNV